MKNGCVVQKYFLGLQQLINKIDNENNRERISLSIIWVCDVTGKSQSVMSHISMDKTHLKNSRGSS